MPRPQPLQQPPPVQRLRVRYAKRGPARFASHRDFCRAFERGLRRAGVPMAYSSGFTPHPRISYANAAPTSAASEAEYLEIALAERCDPATVRAALDAALPPGMDILQVVEASGVPFAELLTESLWLLDFGAVDAGLLEHAVEELLAASTHEVQRMTKAGMRTFDVRVAVVSLRVEEAGVLRLVSRLGTPLVRPDDVVTALRQLEPGLVTGRPVLLTRVRQGPLTGESIGDPLAVTD